MATNPVTQSTRDAPNPSAREYADDWKENVLEPLQGIRDHVHWLSVIRRKKTAGWFEDLLNALLRMAYDYEGRLARGEE